MPKLEQQWFALLAFCAAILTPMPTLAATPIHLSEIAWAGSSLSASDEWIELTNPTTETINLSGWKLTGAGGENNALTFPEGIVIHPHSTFLIGNYGIEHENSSLTVEPNFVTASLSLPNNGFHLHLVDTNDAVIDVAGGTGAPFAGRSGGNADSSDARYVSMVRVDGVVSGTEKTNWMDATLTQNFKENIQDYGSPGVHPMNTPINTEIIKKEIFTESTTTENPTPLEEILEEVTESSEPTVETEVVEMISEEETDVELAENNEVLLEGPTHNEMSETIFVENTLLDQEADVSKETDVSIPNIIISEFLAAPETDQEEWVELRNMGNQPLDVTGWTLEDESGKQTTLQGKIDSEKFLVVTNPTGKLNNDGDSLILKNELSEEVLSLTYGNNEIPAGKKGQSVALDGETYKATEAHTPGTPNLIFIPIKSLEEAENKTEPTMHVEPLKDNTEKMEETVETVETEIINNTAYIRFESLYPNTTGSDETEEYFVLQNTGTEPINLSEWKVSDASKKTYAFENMLIAPNESITVSRTESKIALNNTNETLNLYTPNGVLVETVSYNKSTKGETYDRTENGWEWSTTITPTDEVTNNVSSSIVSTQWYSSKTIQEVLNSPAETNVQVAGVVSASPDTLGKQIFYIQDETGGVQIYFYKGEFPELPLGTEVTVKGETSQSRGEVRIKLSSRDDVNNIGASTTNIQNVNLNEVTKNHVGNLVTTSGLVQSKSSNKLIIEEAGHTLMVYLGSTSPVTTDTYQRGDQLKVTGIVSTYDGELRIRPRTQEDLVIQKKEEILITGTMNETVKPSLWTNASQTGTALLLTTFTAFLGLAIVRLFPRRKALST